MLDPPTMLQQLSVGHRAVGLVGGDMSPPPGDVCSDLSVGIPSPPECGQIAALGGYWEGHHPVVVRIGDPFEDNPGVPLGYKLPVVRPRHYCLYREGP